MEGAGGTPLLGPSGGMSERARSGRDSTTSMASSRASFRTANDEEFADAMSSRSSIGSQSPELVASSDKQPLLPSGAQDSARAPSPVLLSASLQVNSSTPTAPRTPITPIMRFRAAARLVMATQRLATHEMKFSQEGENSEDAKFRTLSRADVENPIEELVKFLSKKSKAGDKQKVPRGDLAVNPAAEDPLLDQIPGLEPVEFSVEDRDRLRRSIPFMRTTLARFRLGLIPARKDLDRAECIEGFEEFKNTKPTRKVRYIAIQDIVLPNKLLKGLGKQLSKFPNVEVLRLDNIGLSELKGLALPNLCYISLESNKISSASSLAKSLQPSSILQRIDVRGNPLCEKKKDWHLPLLARFQNLNILNGRVLSNQDRRIAVDETGSKAAKSTLPWRTWDFTLSHHPEVLRMTQWEPARIQTLNLKGCGLMSIQVGELVNLCQLDVSDNDIPSVMESGLEQCDNLWSLHLANNKIAKLDHCLPAIQLVPCLRDLTLEGNLVNEYRLKVIYATRNLRGLNRSQGLVKIDNVPVVIEERLAALRLIGKMKSAEVDYMRWTYNLIQYYGHHLVRMTSMSQSRAALQSVTVLKLNGRSLTVVEVASLPYLEVVDLRENELTNITGLSTLARLRVLDLAENRKLDRDNVLSQIMEVPSLCDFAMRPSDTASEKKLISFRKNLLEKLVHVLPRLSVLEGKAVTIDERIALYKKRDRMTLEEAENMRKDMALLVACTKPEARVYTPRMLPVGEQYSPAAIQELDLHNLGLASTSLFNVSAFKNLRVLDLSNNGLTALSSLGINDMADLVRLDISQNRFRCPLAEVADMINRLHLLQVVGLTPNPFMNEKNARTKLVALLKGVTDVQCPLRVVDSPLSIDERVAAKEKYSTDTAALDMFRFQITAASRIPETNRPERLTKIDLAGSDLRVIDLRQFKAVRCLFLQDNKLLTLEDCGLETLGDLEVIDLRNNNLRSFQDVYNILSKLPELVSVGLRGNPFSTEKKYEKFKSQFLTQFLPRLQNPAAKLRYLDQEEIALEDVLEIWKKEAKGGRTGSDNLDIFKFKVALKRRLPGDATYSEVDELNLSKAQLSHLDLAAFESLTKLSLANNSITAAQLKEGGVASLRMLKALDVRNNRIDDEDVFVDIVDNLPVLESIYLENNPMFTKNTSTNRYKFLGKLASVGSVEQPLKLLNGEVVLLNERIKAATSSKKCRLNDDEVEVLRFELVMRDLGHHESQATLEKIVLKNYELSIVVGLKKFTLLTHVDLSNNDIEDLGVQGLHELPELHALDIRNNNFKSLEVLVNDLEKLAKLRELFMMDSAPGTSKPKNYAPRVFNRLRAVSTIDGVHNPHPLTKDQWRAADFLYELAGVSPNALVDCNLSGQSLGSDWLMHCVQALAMLPVSTIVANENPWDANPNYRYLFIHNIRGLTLLDHIDINDEEKYNAEKLVRKLDGCDLVRHKVPFTGDRVLRDLQEQTPDAHRRSKSHRGRNLVIAGAAAAGVGAAGVGAGGVAAFVASGGAAAAAGAVAGGLDTGMWLTKFEVFINFFQIFSMINVLDVEWPDFWEKVRNVSMPFNFDMDMAWPTIKLTFPTFSRDVWVYSKFGFFMCLPPVLLFVYYVKMDRDVWLYRYVTHWRRTQFLMWFMFILALVFSAAISLLVDFPVSIERVMDHKLPSSYVFGATGAFWLLILIVFVWRYVAALIFRKYRRSTMFWYKVLKFKQKIALFLMTTLYLPITRIIVACFDVTYSADGKRRMAVLPEHDYPTSILDMHPLMIAAIPFIVLYIFGIPIFFTILVRKNMMRIFIGTGALKIIQKDIAKIRAGPKDGRKKALRDKQAEFDAVYAAAVRRYDSAQSYLYVAYEYRFRYYKTVQMAEKLFLLMIAMYLTEDTLEANSVSVYQTTFSLACVGAFFMLQVFNRPFLSPTEDGMDVASRLANVLNCTVAFLLACFHIGWFRSYAANVILVSVNTMLIVFIVGLVIGSPFVKFILDKRSKKTATSLEEQLMEMDILDGSQKESGNYGILSDDEIGLDDDYFGPTYTPPVDAKQGSSSGGMPTPTSTSKAGHLSSHKSQGSELV